MNNLSASEIVSQAKGMLTPNAGIIALANRDRCIMDEEHTRYPYKNEGGCPDYQRCSDEQYMLACLATRTATDLADWAVDTYYEALGGNSID